MMRRWKNVFRTAQMLKGTTSQFLRAICDNFQKLLKIMKNIEKSKFRNFVTSKCSCFDVMNVHTAA